MESTEELQNCMQQTGKEDGLGAQRSARSLYNGINDKKIK